MEKSKSSGNQQYKVPAGTVTILVIYILLLIVLWGSAYLTMLSRGGTV